MELSNIIDTIIADIDATERNTPAVIYIAIGSAAGLFNSNGLLDDENYHQFPNFLQTFLNEIPKVKLHIVLIDPALENPPYIVKDHSKNLDFNIVEDNHYISEKNHTVHTYCMRKSVYLDCENNYDDFINITADMFRLVEYCKQRSVLLVYNDFTGRENRTVAEFFDDTVQSHLDHIIFGLDARKNEGCYINLLAPLSQFPYRVIERNRIMIKVFNIYDFIIGKNFNTIEDAVQYFGVESVEKITAQIETVIGHCRDKFRNFSMSVLRTVYYLKKGQITEYNVNAFINTVDYKIKKKFTELVKSNNYEELFNFLLVYYSRELNIICKIKGQPENGFEIIKAITSNPDPYQWYNVLRDYI